MNGASLQKNFPETLPDACLALDKLTGNRWAVESVAEYAKGPASGSMEAVRMGINGSGSPRFLLALEDACANRFAARVNAAFGLGDTVDVPAVLAETANIVISAVLNRMSERSGETLIVTAPQGLRGERGQVVSQLMPARARALVARLVTPEPQPTRLELIAVWDA